MAEYQSAYDKHWARLVQLLGESEAAAERARMTVDERADRLRKRVAKFRKDLPLLRKFLTEAERNHRDEYATRLRRQIAHREQVIADEEAPPP
jgi:hypothetical protein